MSNYRCYRSTKESHEIEEKLWDYIFDEFAEEHNMRLKELILIVGHVLFNLVCLSHEGYEEELINIAERMSKDLSSPKKLSIQEFLERSKDE